LETRSRTANSMRIHADPDPGTGYLLYCKERYQITVFYVSSVFCASYLIACQYRISPHRPDRHPEGTNSDLDIIFAHLFSFTRNCHNQNLKWSRPSNIKIWASKIYSFEAYIKTLKVVSNEKVGGSRMCQTVPIWLGPR
jgi:hypothetical protein